MNRQPYGLMAAFESEESFFSALRRLREQGFSRVEAYTPYAVDYEKDLLPQIKSPIPWIMLVAGLCGAVGGFYLQWYAAHDYPLNVGGRPLGSWPSFIPITFELTVLCAALTGLGAFVFLAGFPRLDHPVFSDSRFVHASQDQFFVCLRSDDPLFDDTVARDLFTSVRADSIHEVST